jgi:transposase
MAEQGQLTLAEIERQAIVQTLERTNGNKRAAASILGVYRPTLYGKLRKYKLGEYGASPAVSKKEAGSGSPETSEPHTDAGRRPQGPHDLPPS